MELRGCSVRHFIQSIRGLFAIKVSNIDSNGSPAARSKSLNDVYASEDAKRLQNLPSGSVFDNKQVKYKDPGFRVSPRSLREVNPPDDFVCTTDDDTDSDVDGATTLSQLKKLTKKRKCVSTYENCKQDNASAETVEAESDLHEPLINLKSKHSKATRAKRRCLNPSVTFAIKSEDDLTSEGFPQSGGELAPALPVKVEVPDAEQLGQNEIHSASSAGHNKVLNPGQKIHEDETEPLSHLNKCGNCHTNEISYDHLEEIQPISLLVTVDETSIRLETLQSVLKESLGSSQVEIMKEKNISDSCASISSCSDDPNTDVNSHSSSLVVEDTPRECSSGSHVPDIASNGCIGPPQGSNCILSEDKAEADLPYELKDSLSSPDKNCCSNLSSISTTSTTDPIVMKDDTISDEVQLSPSSLRNEWTSEGHNEDELLKALDKNNSAVSVTCADNEYPSEEGTCENPDTISEPEHHQLPERLFSTRKAFSPSSQERLCLARNSVEIWNHSDQNIGSECKGKLVENQTRKKSSPPRSQVQCDRKTMNHKLSGEASQRKVIIGPRGVIKRNQIAKGNLEGPRFSRIFSNLSTGCTSVQGCSESAVAFSQRQMQDMESIAVKLMNELKSMKDMVEQKLLYESYRKVSLKNDADEVISAISNATKAEEMGRKWISMMTRDCNRFCTIMKMTPDSTSSSKDTLPRGKRKIMFADEAGGELCNVRFFDKSTASPSSSTVEKCGHQS